MTCWTRLVDKYIIHKKYDGKNENINININFLTEYLKIQFEKNKYMLVKDKYGQEMIIAHKGVINKYNIWYFYNFRSQQVKHYLGFIIPPDTKLKQSRIISIQTLKELLIEKSVRTSKTSLRRLKNFTDFLYKINFLEIIPVDVQIILEKELFKII